MTRIPETASSRASRRRARLAMLIASLGLAACAVDFQNREPARELAREARPPGSVYAGWRVFEDRCARCHGADATGTALAPNLLERVRGMGSRRFVGLVLRRYDWSLPAAQGGDQQAALDALVEQIMQRDERAMAMPAWQDEPRVNAHILDLYAYLTARSEGAQGPGRPSP